MRTSVLFFFLSGTLLLYVNALSTSNFSSKKAWEKTLTQESLFQVINDQSCWSDLVRFQACMNATYKMAILSQKKVPLNKNFLNQAREIQLFDQEESDKKNFSIPKSWEDVFKRDSRFSFVYLLTQILPNESDREFSFLIGKALNAYLAARFDPYTYLIPVATYRKVITDPDKNPITSQVIERAGEQKVGYLKVQKMVSRTCEKVKESLLSFEKQGVTQITLDLEGNPGGLFKQGLCIVDLFLKQDVLMVETRNLYKKKNTRQNYYTEKHPVTQLPLTILIDEKTASSAEIVAGSLQSHGRAKVAGVTSYGKGSVQGGVILRSLPRLALFKTHSIIYLPNNKTHHRNGVQPNPVLQANIPKKTAEQL